jgi:putative ABC transport system permease protein
MGLAATIAQRSLLRRPGRTLFSVAGIALGIATVVAIFTLDHNTLIVRSHSDDPDWRAEIEVSPSARVANPRQALANVPGVIGVTAAFQSQASLWTPGEEGGAPSPVFLVAMEAQRSRQLGDYTVIGGRDLDPSSGRNEVLIGSRLAEERGLAPGATISLAPPQRAPSLDCVEGKWVERDNARSAPPRIEAYEVVGVIGREGVGRKGRGEMVLIDLDDAKRLFEGSHVETRYWVRKDPKINLETLEANLGEAWSYDLKKSVIIGQAADERAFRNGVRFAGLLALVLGLYVIFHTLSMSLVERVREVGVLHALGCSRAQIGRVFFTEATIVAGLGGACGLVGGVGLAFAMLRKGITTVGIGLDMPRSQMAELFEVPWKVVGPLVLAGVGIALVGSVFPLAKARNTNAVAALRGEDAAHGRRAARGFHWLAAALLALVLPAVYFGLVPVIGEEQSELMGVILLGLGVLALFVAVPLVAPALISLACAALTRPFERRWPLAGQLASRAMRHGPARIAGGVAGIALVTAGFVGLHGMTRSLEGEIDLWSARAFRDKVYVRNLVPTSFDALSQKFHEHPEVLGIEPNEARTYSPFLILGVDEAELARYGPCAEDARLAGALRDAKAIVLSTRIARHRDYELGDEVHVQTPSGAVETFTVAAISDEYGYFPKPDERLYGVVSQRWMERLFCIDTKSCSSFSVRFQDGTPAAEAEAIVRSVLSELPGAGSPSVEDADYLYAWYSNDIARDFVLFDIILALTLALAGLGVLNGQLLSALERTKELGILKALGTSRGQIAGHVLLESLVIGVVGGLTGAAVGAGVAPVVVRALTVISGLDLPTLGPGPYVALGIAGAIAIAITAGIYPIWRMNRTDATAAVRAP